MTLTKKLIYSSAPKDNNTLYRQLLASKLGKLLGIKKVQTKTK